MATTESFSRPTNLIEVNNIYTKYTFTVFILFPTELVGGIVINDVHYVSISAQ